MLEQGKIMKHVLDVLAEKHALERLKKVALRLLALGTIPLEQIAKVTGLSLDEVKKLQAQQASV